MPVADLPSQRGTRVSNTRPRPQPQAPRGGSIYTSEGPALPTQDLLDSAPVENMFNNFTTGHHGSRITKAREGNMGWGWG